MRVISQKGFPYLDITYEHCTLWLKTPENIIYGTPIGEPDSLMQMAKYSTQEKTQKVIQMLHECYTGMLYMRNLSFPEGGSPEEYLKRGIGFISVIDRGENVKIEPMNIVFRFPQEDEV